MAFIVSQCKRKRPGRGVITCAKETCFPRRGLVEALVVEADEAAAHGVQADVVNVVGPTRVDICLALVALRVCRLRKLNRGRRCCRRCRRCARPRAAPSSRLHLLAAAEPSPSRGVAAADDAPTAARPTAKAPNRLGSLLSSFTVDRCANFSCKKQSGMWPLVSQRNRPRGPSRYRVSRNSLLSDGALRRKGDGRQRTRRLNAESRPRFADFMQSR